MANRDKNGFIHYTPEELAQIPSFEQRSEGSAPMIGGLGIPELTALTGGLAGAGWGPAGAAGGLVAGKAVGDRVAGTTGPGANQRPAGAAAQNRSHYAPQGEPPQMPTEAGAKATLEALDRELREEEVDRMHHTQS